MVEMNGYVLALLIAIATVSWTVETVKEPVKAAIVRVEHGAKKVGRGLVHVVTLGQK